MKKLAKTIWVCLKKNIISLIAFILFLVTSLFYKNCNNPDNELFLGIIGSIATLYFGIIKYQIESDKFRLDLIKSFNVRYNDKLNDVFNKLNDNNRVESNDFSKDDRCTIIDYFNLCAEEYYWYKRNRIPEDIWAAWLFGINKNLSKPGIKKLFDEEIKEFGISYYGLEKVIDKK